MQGRRENYHENLENWEDVSHKTVFVKNHEMVQIKATCGSWPK